ncbi:hypothetical protein BU26DRAFT_309095 [Trematosphaeria pertusa]|uniref:Uncharacterized protein n=1 Tax=Trematosphaeria pertusa TaxID=390896 RepID=A0A6A6IHD9_9PLEO|nr:uncharacterized protein BU26DRAFT_309095 [Trematosphaeria pertusa]KAF2248943.1 hypothetical protein BU26DRAFT_309095 [Trematosphaeria pertusa]
MRRWRRLGKHAFLPSANCCRRARAPSPLLCGALRQCGKGSARPAGRRRHRLLDAATAEGACESAPCATKPLAGVARQRAYRRRILHQKLSRRSSDGVSPCSPLAVWVEPPPRMAVDQGEGMLSRPAPRRDHRAPHVTQGAMQSFPPKHRVTGVESKPISTAQRAGSAPAGLPRWE